MPVTKEQIADGVTLAARYKGQIVKATVGKNDEGSLTYTVNGQTFNSPSKAGSYAAGNTSVNGYRFWSLEAELGEGRKPAAPKAEKAEKPAKASKGKPASAKATPIIKKQRKQEGAPEGETIWFCSACMKPFNAPTGETPVTCPEGHGQADAATSDETEAPAATSEEPVELEI